MPTDGHRYGRHEVNAVMRPDGEKQRAQRGRRVRHFVVNNNYCFFNISAKPDHKI